MTRAYANALHVIVYVAETVQYRNGTIKLI